MRILQNIGLDKVFFFFEELTRIPRGSGNTKAVSDYCVNFAKERGLEVISDKIGNVLIKKNASLGYEKSGAVILQGHLDMVCVGDGKRDIDFEKEAVKPYIDGDWIKAEGTTLGADDGIAVAMALAILDSNDLKHPPIEAVFTVDEEVGLKGATAFDTSALSGKRLINIDSEEEGIITVSCAGGVRVFAKIPLKKDSFKGDSYKIKAAGMSGGHSGVDIDKNRANANKVMAYLLSKIREKTEMRIADFSGGLRENAIPAGAEAVICVKEAAAMKAAFDETAKEIKEKYKTSEPMLYFEIKAADSAAAYDAASTNNILYVINQNPDGIISMSKNISMLPQTSLNLGAVSIDNDTLKMAYSLRSSVDAEKIQLCKTVTGTIEKAGGKPEVSGDYGAWEYKENSQLRDKAVEVFRDMYGREPEIAAIHAGLECGIFAGKIDGADCISIGPDMKDVHTVHERLSISSTKRVYKYLIELLSRM